MEKEVISEKVQEILEKLNINLKELESEQLLLKKSIVTKDSIDFDKIETIAGCGNSYFDNEIISSIAVLNKNMEVIEEKFFMERMHFPYVSGFRAYREMPAMLKCYHKLENSPDVIMIEGNGILHPRGIGLASHFGLSIQKPTIGIAKDLIMGEVKDNKVYLNNKIVAEAVETKKGSNPIYISPGHMISLESAVKLVKKCMREPRKLPEPVVLAHRYAKKIREEFSVKKE